MLLLRRHSRHVAAYRHAFVIGRPGGCRSGAAGGAMAKMA
jgi:hypothetical protein